MSGNEEDKGDINKVYPLDLVSKLNVKPVTEIPKGTPLLMTGQPLRRVLTQAVAVCGGSGSSSNIVPQTMIKQGILNPSQPLTVARPTQITLATSVVQSQPSGATYHVPRGAATVANLATPRSVVATQIRAPGGIVATPQQSIGGSGFVSTVRQVTPLSSRTPSPATTWLATTGNVNVNMNMHLPNQQIVKNVASTAAQLQRISTVVGRTQIITRTTQSAASVASVTPLSTVGQLRQPQNVGVLHSTIQQQIFKTTLAQVLPTKSQTLVYSTGTANANANATATAALTMATNQSQHHHFMARTQGITRQTTTTTTTATATTTTTTTSGGTRSINQMIGARVAVPVTSATQLTVTSGSTTIYTTGARLSVAAGPSASSARLNLQQQQSVRPISNVATAGTLLTTTQARITTPQQPSAVVIGTQAGGRLAASVVSLHPVVVNNPLSSASSASSCTSTSTSTCTSSKQQQSKIITQGNQGQAIQLAQVPTVTKLPVVPVSSTMSNQQSVTRTINTAIVSQRPPAQTISIPITKVFPATATSATTTPIIRRTATSSPVTSNPNENEVTYYYQDAGKNMSGQSFQFSPVMVVEQTKASNSNQSLMNNPNQMEHITVNPLPSIGKVTSSPRPSILRKRDRDDGSTLKAAKNLAPLLSNIGGVPVTVAVVAGPSSPPSRPLSRDRDNNGGNSSGGSTTISATSSPGLAEIGGDDSQPLPPVVVVQPPAPSQVALKLTEEVNRRHHIQEMSPRKKPRKQQLIGNDEPKFNIEDMQFLSENKMKKETEHNIHMHIHTTTAATTPTAATTTPAMTSTSSALNINSKTLNNNNNNNNNELTVKKPQTASLLNSYRQTWKSTHNHYLRYTDVKPKDERRPTIIDLANQTQVMQKINGWKIHHLSTQMEDLCDLETQVYDKLSTMLKLIETKESRGYDKDFNRINELIKGNMQRSKIINDSTSEAKSQVMKIFEHKEHVADIIQRCASKRNFKKREK